MRRRLTAAACAAALVAPPVADAAIPQVFTETASPLNCAVQVSGQRFCGATTAQIPSWDGIPLDVSVAFPAAPASGADDRHGDVLGRRRDAHHERPGHLANGALRLPQPLRVELAKSSWTGPTANERVDVTFRQASGRTDALRTGTYSKTVTFRLSTTTP